MILLFLCFIQLSCEEFILGPDPENTPANNFDILWGEFDRYYPSFISRNINWDSLYSVYRPQITRNTTEAELWYIICSMLYNFNDFHVALYNSDGSKAFSSSHFYPNKFEFSLPLVISKYLNNKYKTAGEGNFTYARFPGDTVGYIHIKSFDGNDNWYEDIDGIIRELSDTKAIILDIRNNSGGYVESSEYIGSVLIDHPVTYCKEITRNGPNHYDFTEPVYRTVEHRSNSPFYTKRIILLTNHVTASTAELFALFLKQLPNSEQIGGFTRGGLVGIRGFQLVNGWLYFMPIIVGLTIDGENLQDIGVAPDINIVNTEEEVQYMHIDRQLEFTLQYLSK